MKLREMEKGVRYIVTTGGSTLKKGDSVVMESDGCLVCFDAGGFLPRGEWRNLRNEVEIDIEYYKQQIKELKSAIYHYNQLIKKGKK